MQREVFSPRVLRFLMSFQGIMVLYAGQLSAVLPFVVSNSLQTLPHPSSVGAGVVEFNLSPVLTLCLFDGSSEGIAGFLTSFQVRVPLLESGSSTLYLSADDACNPWFLVGICTYSHYGDDVINVHIDEASN